MKKDEIKPIIIENFIDYFTSDEDERYDMKNVLADYMRDDHVDELAALIGELEYYTDLAAERGKMLAGVYERLDKIEAMTMDIKEKAEDNIDLLTIGQAIMNGKNKVPKTGTYHIRTNMGKISTSDQIKLAFLTDNELDELNSIGYSGKTLDGKPNTREYYLNSLNKGTFTVECTNGDRGDFAETWLITRTI